MRAATRSDLPSRRAMPASRYTTRRKASNSLGFIAVSGGCSGSEGAQLAVIERNQVVIGAKAVARRAAVAVAAPSGPAAGGWQRQRGRAVLRERGRWRRLP